MILGSKPPSLPLGAGLAEEDVWFEFSKGSDMAVEGVLERPAVAHKRIRHPEFISKRNV